MIHRVVALSVVLAVSCGSQQPAESAVLDVVVRNTLAAVLESQSFEVYQSMTTACQEAQGFQSFERREINNRREFRANYDDIVVGEIIVDLADVDLAEVQIELRDIDGEVVTALGDNRTIWVHDNDDWRLSSCDANLITGY